MVHSESERQFVFLLDFCHCTQRGCQQIFNGYKQFFIQSLLFLSLCCLSYIFFSGVQPEKAVRVGQVLPHSIKFSNKAYLVSSNIVTTDHGLDSKRKMWSNASLTRVKYIEDTAEKLKQGPEALNWQKKHHDSKRARLIPDFNLKEELEITFYSDQTGTFPVASYKDNQYIMIACVTLEPIKTRAQQI